MTTIELATDADRERALASLVAGFIADPVTRWCWPEPEAYLANMSRFADAYGGRAFSLGSACVDEQRRGAALWLGPGEHPEEPHWFLPIIAVDPAWQGCGIGSELMAHAVAECDAMGCRAYLESSNPRNISLYERHGFKVIGEVEVGNCPVLTSMLREPQ